MDSSEQPLVPVSKRKTAMIKEENSSSEAESSGQKSWPHFGLLAALAQRQKCEETPQFNYHRICDNSKTSCYPNPILALIANRSSSLFGFLRPVANPAPAVLDLPTILMLQTNILTMINNQNRQVGQNY